MYTLDTPFFELKKVMDKNRDDFSIINDDYENIVFFKSNKSWRQIFAFNFCTLHFYTMREIIINKVKCYKEVKKLNSEIPNNIKIYNWEKDPKTGFSSRQKYKIYNLKD
jgi:hypothetical protein